MHGSQATQPTPPDQMQQQRLGLIIGLMGEGNDGNFGPWCDVTPDLGEKAITGAACCRLYPSWLRQ
jgi:hypothetical protein